MLTIAGGIILAIIIICFLPWILAAIFFLLPPVLGTIIGVVVGLSTDSPELIAVGFLLGCIGSWLMVREAS